MDHLHAEEVRELWIKARTCVNLQEIHEIDPDDPEIAAASKKAHDDLRNVLDATQDSIRRELGYDRQ